MKKILIPVSLVGAILISVFVFDVSGWIDSQNLVKLREKDSTLISTNEVHEKKSYEGEIPKSELGKQDEEITSDSPTLSDSLKEEDGSDSVESPVLDDNTNEDIIADKNNEDSSKGSQGALNTKGKVKGVWLSTKDGDTITAQFEEDGQKVTETIRLLLIDTPESVHPDKKVEAYGIQASRYTGSIKRANKDIFIEIGNPQRDDYGRLLAYVWLEDGTMLNMDLVRKGYARVGYIFPPNTKYLDELKEAQNQAKKEKLRIWSIDNYVTDRGFNMDVVTDKDLLKIRD
ncbi:thermonuclease family protein [Lysinibacillus sp. 1P01SD]|uniref:thermonuclease family protein n=1 Tax=Lysinibacillus sp. 1P01SD TaxID=3132285 RepID=UPI0039A1AB57